MEYTVGQEIANGQLVVVSVDSSGDITAVVPANKDEFGNPFTVSYSPGVTEALIVSIAQAIVGSN